MKQTVNFCGNCPFLSSEYDDFAVGHSTVDKCLLAQHLGQDDYFVSIHDNFGQDFEASTPVWCPLKKEEFSFDFKEFSDERKQNLESTKNEILELENFFDMREDEVDYDDPEIIEKTDNIRKLYSKLNELYSNEELSEDDVLKNEINDGIEKINEQLTLLKEISSKFSETFNVNNNEKD